MPGLISNYQKRVWVAQLQKSMNVWNNGMALMLSQQGVESLYDTEFTKALEDKYGMGDFSSGYYSSSRPIDDSLIKKYFKVAKIDYSGQSNPHKINCLDGNYYSPSSLSGEARWYMADGTLFYIFLRYMEDPTIQGTGYVLVDVNGAKGPNTWGRDVFQFGVKKDGKLFPRTSEEGKALGDGYYTWKDVAYYCGVAGSSNVSGVQGNGCAARIIEEGWVMNY